MRNDGISVRSRVMLALVRYCFKGRNKKKSSSIKIFPNSAFAEADTGIASYTFIPRAAFTRNFSNPILPKRYLIRCMTKASLSFGGAVVFFLTSLMAPYLHPSTQTPQPMQRSRFTRYMAFFPEFTFSTASIWHLAMHSPHFLHEAVSMHDWYDTWKTSAGLASFFAFVRTPQQHPQHAHTSRNSSV